MSMSIKQKLWPGRRWWGRSRAGSGEGDPQRGTVRGGVVWARQKQDKVGRGSGGTGLITWLGEAGRGWARLAVRTAGWHLTGYDVAFELSFPCAWALCGVSTVPDVLPM
jgi:hypothetical protein